ncbi:MAG: PTS transporter subunit EIIC, partial [Cetobacterium sp.]
DKYFDKKLPDFLGIFQGSAFVVIVSFIPTLLLAVLTAIVWPKVQSGIGSLQIFLASSGALGVWIYTFLERLLIPTGLHHFIYTPFTYGPAVVDEGITKFWAENLTHFSQLTVPLKSVFPQGGFSLFGNSKIFGAIGIAIAFYFTSKSEKKKAVMGLLIPATLTAVLVGITEPLEFTFLFIAPVLFLVHSILAASMAAIMYSFGVVGSMGSGLINTATLNWIPLFKNHSGMIYTQIIIGILFIGIYVITFKLFIEKLNLKTPGREDDEEVKLYSKADFKSKQDKSGKGQSQFDEIAYNILMGLGGAQNIVDVTNCATRLRLTVNDANLIETAGYFKHIGTHGLVKNGNAIQIIVGLSVPQVRESFEKLLDLSNEEVTIQV